MTMRWALVTGATGTVGSACARALAVSGFAVHVHGRRPDAVSEAVDALRSAGRIAEPFLADLGDPGRTEEAVRRLGAEDRAPLVLVNAAAEFGPLAPVAEIPGSEWSRLLAVNLESPLALIRSVLPGMLGAGWGRVIQVSSAAALAAPGAGNAAYSVTKAALDRALGHLAADLGGTGVTVHSFHPGEFASRMWEHIKAESGAPGLEGFAEWAQRTGGSPDDPEAVVRFVRSLLNDEEAERRHGAFSWAQQPDREPQPLR